MIKINLGLNLTPCFFHLLWNAKRCCSLLVGCKIREKKDRLVDDDDEDSVNAMVMVMMDNDCNCSIIQILIRFESLSYGMMLQLDILTVGSITNDTRKKRTILFTTVCKLREREGERSIVSRRRRRVKRGKKWVKLKSMRNVKCWTKWNISRTERGISSIQSINFTGQQKKGSNRHDMNRHEPTATVCTNYKWMKPPTYDSLLLSNTWWHNFDNDDEFPKLWNYYISLWSCNFKTRQKPLLNQNEWIIKSQTSKIKFMIEASSHVKKGSSKRVAVVHVHIQ